MFEKLYELRAETIAVLVLLVISSIFIFILMKKGKLKMGTRVIVYAGLCISLSFVLSSIRIIRMPQGGSVTPASMLPLFIFAFIFGPLPGILAGMAYGFLQLLQDAFVVHWAQLILDYPLAFAAIGIAGCFKRFRTIGILSGAVTKTFFHVLSGFIFFSEYAPEGQNAVIYSIIYNGTFMSVETAITIVLAIPILAALGRAGKLRRA